MQQYIVGIGNAIQWVIEPYCRFASCHLADCLGIFSLFDGVILFCFFQIKKIKHQICLDITSKHQSFFFSFFFYKKNCVTSRCLKRLVAQIKLNLLLLTHIYSYNYLQTKVIILQRLYSQSNLIKVTLLPERRPHSPFLLPQVNFTVCSSKLNQLVIIGLHHPLDGITNP